MVGRQAMDRVEVHPSTKDFNAVLGVLKRSRKLDLLLALIAQMQAVRD